MQNKALYVGDPHATVSNLTEMKKLINFVFDTAIENKVDFVVFLGDLFHTHAILRLEVMDFWTWVFTEAARRGIVVVALTGNHDKPGSKEKEHISALSVFKYWKTDFVRIIDEPSILYNIAFIPYYHSEELVIEHATNCYNQGAKKCAVMHQTFTGAAYENGFYAKDAIDPAKIPQEELIVGHIHTEQQIGKAWYPATAKWDTMGDANQNKGIWIVVHNEDGSYDPLSKQFFSTENVCTPIKTFLVTEGDKLPVLKETDRNHVTLVGTSDWIKKTKKEIDGKANIKGKPTNPVTTSFLTIPSPFLVYGKHNTLSLNVVIIKILL